MLESKNSGRQGKDNTRLVLFGSVKAKDGLPVLVALDIRPIERNLAIDGMQKVTSAYTKDVSPVEFLRGSRVLYADNKKTTSLLRTMGFKAPIELNDSGFVGSISYNKQNVKFHGKPFADVVTESADPTSDPDIRHSLREGVEEVHKAREVKLEKYSYNELSKMPDRDSSGKTLTEAQQVFFVDSKIRDKDGNLQVMYHGSPRSFTIFDRKKAKSSGLYGRGFYFTNSSSHASQYGSNYEVYLNIKNPLQAGAKRITKNQLREFVGTVAENEDYGIENYGYNATVDSVVESIYGKDDFALITDVNATCIGDMVDAVKLFNEVCGTDYDGIVVPTETVAFYPEQIKNTTNTNPTSDPDIRYSDRDGNIKEARELTEQDFRDLLDKIYPGMGLDPGTYIPVRVSTPLIFIDVVEEHSNGTIKVDNLPMASKVEHVYQNMEEDDGSSYGNERPHGLDADDMVRIAEKMGDPTYIVLQRNGRYAEVVSFVNRRNKKVVVSIDIATGGKNYKYSDQVNGYNNGYYNIVVTEFEPDSLDSYLNKNEIVYSKMKNESNQVGSGSIISVTHDSPFFKSNDNTETNFVKQSERDTSLDPRTLLSNALVETARNDIEKKYISEYRNNISRINAEQEKLANLKAEIRELSFARGPRDKVKLRSLQEEATKTTNRIDIYDKKLLRLEATKPLQMVIEREKAKARKKALEEGRVSLDRYRERAAADRAELVEKYRGRVTSRKMTEVRNKIKSLVEELRSRELNPRANRYIPAELMKPVGDILSALNTDSGKSEKLSARLAELKVKYDEIAKNPKYAMAYDSVVAEMGQALIEKIGDTSIYEMTREQLESTYTFLKSLMYTIKNAVKVRNIDTEMNAFEISQEMRRETDGVGRASSGVLSRWISTSLRPETAFARFGGFKKGSMWSKVYDMLNRGQLRKMQIEMESNAIFGEVLSDKKYVKSLSDYSNPVDIGLKDDNGNPVKVTRGMALAIYKALMNEDNRASV